ncbi:elongation factor G [Bifidobacterium boum]|uniref:elongation factor G n=1 Tax=Bifidobacterium boum TaxID=78343 RepID=UPI00242A74D2|nr:TetM/TetW/TetO/TetS family tetracycline resistance ribosomal protection protein [Bifidobacterium boum]MCI5861443.1 TetM/TetW/TetO/TetS family tetracycline resistance ribosomal protection protein [Bifidobacterium boum]
MKQIVAGVLAHVDAGKTTLSEAMLYVSGQVRRLGRVDHGDAFLDTDALEKRRGITIYSKDAIIDYPGMRLTLLDTPGHVDFAADMERTLGVLDVALLVISAVDGVQGHTETLWRLLERYHVPTIIVINKIDALAPDISRDDVLVGIRRRFGDRCVDAGWPGDTADTAGSDGAASVAGSRPVNPDDSDDISDADAHAGSRMERDEDVAALDESALDEFCDTGRISPTIISRMIAQRKLVPCLWTSALQLHGIRYLLDTLANYAPQPHYDKQHDKDFGARVFRVSHDAQHNRLTWLKVTGGELPVKSDIEPYGKIDQIRQYSGAKFDLLQSAPAGTVCAVTGLQGTIPGQGLGAQADASHPLLEPVLTYTVTASDGTDAHKLLGALRELEDEEPLLHVRWIERLEEIHIQLMGAVQLEIVQELLRTRFGIEVTFDRGGIVYHETIDAPVEGVGHFEPLRHYAEVHLLLEPLERGSGLQFASDCSLDVLDRNWQRLIMTHMREREHLGVLIGAPIADMRITLLTGRAHDKHTEGGDFRQATYRAIREGLMQARQGGHCHVLEPWYRFRLELPADQVGHAMADIQRMSGTFDPPDNDGMAAVLEGEAPVEGMRDYAMEVNAYTHGRGSLTCVSAGYRPCHDEDAVIAAADYDPESDVENTPDSVFCAHGAGYPVKWYKVPEFMHLPFAWQQA